MIGRGNFCFGNGGSDKRVVCKQIEFPWEALRGLKERFDGCRLKKRKLGARTPQKVREICTNFICRERPKVESDDDALSERFVHGHIETSTKLAVSQKKQAQSILRVHFVVGQKTQLLEDVASKAVRFVDNEDRPDARFTAENRVTSFLICR